MRLLKFSSILLISVLFLGAKTPGTTLSCHDIINQMLDSIKKIRTQRYEVKAVERVNGGFHISESKIKLNISPRQIYFQSPTKGVEVLWTQGANKGNATVHSKTLPFINLDLDPYGSIMRKDQHHTIFDLGFHFIGTTIGSTITKAPKDFDKHFAYAGTLIWNKIDCYQILINYPEYKYIDYTTGKGETVSSISYKLHTSDYKIRYKNELSSYFGAIKEGKKLLIPIPYANKTILYIDKKTFIPLSIKVYDDEGLYESYEFYNVRLNTTFASDEFLTSYKEYGF